jgi:hypothetical protein
VNKGAAAAWLVAAVFYGVLVYCIRAGDGLLFPLATVVGALVGVGLFAAGHISGLHEARTRQLELARRLAETQRARGADRGE